jgi:hypothetical protein
MSPTNTLIRFKRLLLIGAVVAGAVVPAAQAVGRPPDVQDTARANLAAQINRPPDVRDAAVADVVERYAATQQSLVSQPPDIRDTSLMLRGQADFAVSPSVALRGMADFAVRPPDVQDTAASLAASAPDVVERFAIAHPDGLGFSSASVSRPPDISDRALAVQYGSVTQSSTGFDWGDWAIGIGSGLGLALLLGGCFLMARQLRHGVQTA